jgi:mitochondrial fission protein ELM1
MADGPLIWLLLGSKTGDNAQVLRAAEAMALAFTIKRLVLRPEFETAKPRVAPSLAVFDSAMSDALVPPWPDLVITIGRRLSMAALWIKQQSQGRSKIALFNAPKGCDEAFDLIVVPSFYDVPPSPRLCRIELPLIAADAERIAAARSEFHASIAAMPKPLHVLLLGGDMGSRPLDPAAAAGIVGRMRQSHAARGSIYVSTSRRTPPAAADAVARELRPGDMLYRWRAGAPDNPYFGLLAFGDSFTITADSLSMLTEVARLGKPIAIAAPRPSGGIASRLRRLTGLAPRRDLDAAAQHLIAGGYAAELGQPLPHPKSPPPDETAEVAQRLRRLATSGR